MTATPQAAATPKRPRPAVPTVVAACFFLSGAAGLLFETLWARAFGLVLGNSLQGIAVVTGVFLAGLGVGAALASRAADRLRRPVLWYAWLELGVGAWGVAGSLLLPALPGLLAGLMPAQDAVGALPYSIRIVAAILFLAPPTILMGTTLPLLAAGLAREGAYLADFGLLYGLNTLGAFTGTFLGGFVLLPALGMRRSAWLAAGLNTLVFCFARWFASRAPRESAADSAAVAAEAPAPPAPLPPQSSKRPGPRRKRPETPLPARAPVRIPAWALGPLCLIAGAIALACEVSWTRGLSLVLGPSTYTFSLILTVFLFGGGIGSLAWRWRGRPPADPLFAYGVLLLGIAASVAISVLLLNRSATLFLYAYHFTARSRAWIVLGLFAQAALPILVPAVLFGLHFPLTGEIFHARGDRSGAAAGHAYLWNSAGTLAGSILAGFVLLPLLGTATTLRVAAALAAVLGAWLVSRRFERNVALGTGVPILAALLCGVFVVRGPGLQQLLSQQGIYRMVNPRAAAALPAREFADKVLGTLAGKRTLFLEEGRLATVAVTYDQHILAITVSGKADASYLDMATQILIGQMPMMLHPHPREVFLLGYGSGVTAGAMAAFHPDRMDIAEIEPAVVHGARYFRHLTHGTLEQPSVHLHIEDGRTMLAYGRRRYDVIASEPTNPWISGVNNLFTEEFYRIVRARLNPGGVFSQWFPLYDLSRPSLSSMLRSLTAVFPHYLLFEAAGGDMIVVASRDGPLDAGPGAWTRGVAPGVRDWLTSAGIAVPQDAAVRLINDESWANSTRGPLNRDDNGFVEYRAPWELPAFQFRRIGLEPESLATAAPIALLHEAGWPTDAGGLDSLLGRAVERNRVALVKRARAEAETSGRPLPPALLAEIRDCEERFGRQREGGRYVGAAERAMQAGQADQAMSYLRQAYAVQPDNPLVAARLASLLLDQGRYDDARALLLRQLSQTEWALRYVVLSLMGVVETRAGRPQEALAWMGRAIGYDPYREEGYLDKAALLTQLGRRDEALALLAEGVGNVPWSEALRTQRDALATGR